MNYNSNMRIVALGFSMIFGLFHIVNVQQDAFAHKTDVHGYCEERHDTEQPNLTQHSIAISRVDFHQNDIKRMKEGAVHEDSIEYWSLFFFLIFVSGIIIITHTQAMGESGGGRTLCIMQPAYGVKWKAFLGTQPTDGRRMAMDHCTH